MTAIISDRQLFQELTSFVQEKTINKGILGRGVSAIKFISKEEGAVKASLITGGIIISFCYAGTFIYFCLEGTYRSLDEGLSALSKGEVIRELGDAGGWLALPIFVSMALQKVFKGFLHDVEFYSLKTLLSRQGKEVCLRKPNLSRIKLKTFIQNQISIIAAQTLFQKRLVDIEVSAIKITNKCIPQKKTKKELTLLLIFKELQTKITEAISYKNYLKRVRSGLTSIKATHGISGVIQSTLTGIALPILLLSCSVLSFMGEPPLMEEVLVHKEDKPAAGHIGEWAFNGFESAIAAYLTHKWTILNSGDFILIREIFEKKLAELQSSPYTHNKVCDLANKELSILAANLHFIKLPLDYQFEKIYTKKPNGKNKKTRIFS